MLPESSLICHVDRSQENNSSAPLSNPFASLLKLFAYLLLIALDELPCMYKVLDDGTRRKHGNAMRGKREKRRGLLRIA